MRNIRWLLTLLVALAGGLETRGQAVIGVGVLGPAVPVWTRGPAYGYPHHHHYRSITVFGSSGSLAFPGNPYFAPASGLALVTFATPVVVTPVVARPAPGIWLIPGRRPLEIADEGDINVPLRRPPAELPAPGQGLAPGVPAGVF